MVGQKAPGIHLSMPPQQGNISIPPLLAFSLRFWGSFSDLRAHKTIPGLCVQAVRDVLKALLTTCVPWVQRSHCSVWIKSQKYKVQSSPRTNIYLVSILKTSGIGAVLVRFSEVAIYIMNL